MTGAASHLTPDGAPVDNSDLAQYHTLCIALSSGEIERMAFRTESDALDWLQESPMAEHVAGAKQKAENGKNLLDTMGLDTIVQRAEAYQQEVERALQAHAKEVTGQLPATG